MKSNYQFYNYEKSIERINEILKAEDTSYEEMDSVPSRDKLTFTNGFYVYCSSMFVDIRGSSNLPEKYKRPTLAKLYRAYISEIVAVINGESSCVEINIAGDGVWGVFDTEYISQINNVFGTAAQISSIVEILNCRLKKNKIDPIEIGVGIDYGRALMIKAGYSGSGINEVVYMGDVVNQASKLCGYGNKEGYDFEIMVSEVIYDNLNKGNQKLLSWNNTRGCWHGNVINTDMSKWVADNC
ncbi:MAG TPA: adenylate/guanylate cyclase domain-containing protein [Bacteroidetes bacterium]|nr:adenylate/guanylate cyclase domain-containing protein [Bacteroidota bacterium]